MSVHRSAATLPGQMRGDVASGDGWHVFSLLLTGVLLFGGLGWLGDSLLHTRFLLPIGLVGGAAVSLYSVYMRHFYEVPAPSETASPETSKGRR